MDKKELTRWMEEQRNMIVRIAGQIWDNPETKFEEKYAAKLYTDEMQKRGFEVKKKVGGLDTAFCASYSNGRPGPVIAILGEYDALANMSQKADVSYKEAVEGKKDGHGCGHNLLGAASALAAWGVQEWMMENNIPGTVRLYGCPAEEGGGGKGYMVQNGAFSGVDAVISWHPADYNFVTSGSSLANEEIDFTFDGKAAHAASAPHLGRSALDAVELMDIGANYLREHIIPEARLHYAIIDTGGVMPGIVQEHAVVRYTVRAPEIKDVDSIVERLINIAKGAALMTETQMKKHIMKKTKNLIPNHTLEEVVYRNMQFCEIPEPDKSELQYAKAIKKTMPKYCTLDNIIKKCNSEKQREYIKQHRDDWFYNFLLPWLPSDATQAYSTDVGDVSQVCPTVQLAAGTWVADSMEHTWQVTAQGKSSYACKGTLYAAQVMACAVADLFMDQEVLNKAKAELLRKP